MGKHRRAARHELQIRSRTEISGSGRRVSFHSVFCPRQGQSVGLAECESCPQARGLFVGPEHDELHCDAAAGVASAENQGSLSLRDAAERTPVSSVMTHDVVCVRADVSLAALISTLLERGTGGLPVLDEHGRPIGIVSKTDLVRQQRERATETSADDITEPNLGAALCGRGTVADVMTPVAFTVPEQASIASAAAVMASRTIHRLPVVDQFGTVVGVLSSTDFVDWVAQGAPAKLLRRGREASGSK